MNYYAFQTKDGQWHQTTGHTRRHALGCLRFLFNMQDRPDITFAGPWVRLKPCPGIRTRGGWPKFHNEK